MKFFPKKRNKIPRHKWYAWYPVWAWGPGIEGQLFSAPLGFVWLEWVWREQNDETSLSRYTYHTLDSGVDKRLP